MAISYVGGKVVSITGSSGSTTNVALTDLGGALAEDDIVLVAYAVASSGGVPVDIGVSTAGYTEIAQPSADSGSIVSQISVSLKRMGASPDASVDVSATGDPDYPGVVLIQAWRGVDTANALDVTSTTALTTDSMLANPPSITPVSTGAVVAAFGAGARLTDFTNLFTSSDLSNFQAGEGNVAGTQVQIGGGSIAYAGSAINPAAFGFAGNDNPIYSAAALSLALRPIQTPRVGTASGALALLGAASGGAPVVGAASGALPLSGSSVQGSLATGTASGTLPLSGSGTGGATGGPIAGTASGTLPLSGSASQSTPASPPAPSIPAPATPERVGIIIRQFRVVTAGPDAAVVSRYGNLARDTEEPLETFFDVEADAQAMANERLVLLSVTRSLVTVQIEGTATGAGINPSLALPTVTVIDDEQGRNSDALVFGVSIDMNTERTTLETWG